MILVLSILGYMQWHNMYSPYVQLEATKCNYQPTGLYHEVLKNVFLLSSGQGLIWIRFWNQAAHTNIINLICIFLLILGHQLAILEPWRWLQLHQQWSFNSLANSTLVNLYLTNDIPYPIDPHIAWCLVRQIIKVAAFSCLMSRKWNLYKLLWFKVSFVMRQESTHCSVVHIRIILNLVLNWIIPFISVLPAYIIQVICNICVKLKTDLVIHLSEVNRFVMQTRVSEFHHSRHPLLLLAELQSMFSTSLSLSFALNLLLPLLGMPVFQMYWWAWNHHWIASLTHLWQTMP